ncbi:hypothetical protein KRX11_10305 [Pasteurellaceae bacterium TAE3-ERU1]|nr:hypothetical protein [Pasteurellaceae bacterium TAE3-ERU1]
MPSPFDEALAHADVVISDTMMSEYQINGEKYLAVFDESPHELEPMTSTYKTLTLYKTSGYRPRKGDSVIVGDRAYLVTSYTTRDGLITIHLEDEGGY